MAKNAINLNKNNVASTTLNLIIAAQDLASAIMKKMEGATAALESKVSGLAKGGLQSMNNSFKKTGELMVVTAAGATGLATTFASLGFHEAVKIQEAMADVQKSAGLTTGQVAGLRDQILDLSTTTATKNIELIGIAKIGGAIGVAKEELMNFTSAIDKVSTALGDEFSGGAEEVSSKLGTLRNLFKDTAAVPYGEAMLKIGSAINSLGASGTATGPVVAEFANRIGQLGSMGPSITQTLGLGAAMQELGLSAEISSGGLTNVFLTAGRESKKFANQLGLSEKAFQALYKASPNDMLLRLAESFKNIANDPVALAQKMNELKIGSQESVKVLGLLATKTDMVKEKQALAADEYAKGTSIIDEYTIKNGTLAAAFQKAANMFTKFSTAMWNSNLGGIAEQFNGLLEKINQFDLAMFLDDLLLIPDLFSSIVNGGAIIAENVPTAFYDLVQIIGGDGAKQSVIGVLSDMQTKIAEAKAKFEEFKTFIQPAIDKFSELNQNGELVKAMLVGISTVILVNVIGAIGLMVLSAAAAAAPFVILAGVIAAMFYLYENNTAVKDFVDGAWKKLTDAFEYAKTGLIPDLEKVWKSLSDAFGWFVTNVYNPLLKPSIDGIFDGLGKLATNVMNLWNVISPILIPVLEFLAKVLGVVLVAAVALILTAIDEFIKNLNWLIEATTRVINGATEIWERYKNNVIGIFEGIWKYITGWIDIIIGIFTGNPEKINSGIRTLLGGVEQVFTSVFGGAKDAVTKIIDEITSGAKSAITWVEKALGKKKELTEAEKYNNQFSTQTDGNTVTKIPNFATGTDFFSGGLAQVNEQGGEIMNLPRGTQIIPHDISKRMADKAGSNSSSSSQNIKIEIGGISLQIGSMMGSEKQNREIADQLGDAILVALSKRSGQLKSILN